MSDVRAHHCALCGAAVRGQFRAPQPEIAPDLDMRPGEPARSTLRDWVEICGTCGAAAPDLTALPPEAKPVVESEPYRALSTDTLEECLPFLRWAMICRGTGNAAEAAEATLQAAWAADDAATVAAAAALRKQVAELWGGPEDEETALRQIDVLRRAGEFERAEGCATALEKAGMSELARQIVTFQRARIGARDIGRHLISSALPPPAVAPHVSHGRQQRTNPRFWSRLFGS
jgi:hypothetical protein